MHTLWVVRRQQLADWLEPAAAAKRRKLSMVSATYANGQAVTGVLVPRCAHAAFRSVLEIHEDQLRRRLDGDAAAAALQPADRAAQPLLAQALIKGAPPPPSTQPPHTCALPRDGGAAQSRVRPPCVRLAPARRGRAAATGGSAADR